MSYVQRVVFVDIAVNIRGEMIEDVGLERIGRLHYECVEVKPPEPKSEDEH